MPLLLSDWFLIPYGQHCDLFNIGIGGSVSNCKEQGVGNLAVDLICTLSMGSWVRCLSCTTISCANVT